MKDTTNTIELSDYEKERGKPPPGKLHSITESRLTVYLFRHYSRQYEVFLELTLDTFGKESTPDISIYPLEPIDFSHDEIKCKIPPLAAIQIIAPTQSLQSMVDKTNDYFSFGVKSCWIVLPMLQSVYVFHAPHTHEVYSHGEELYDPNLDIRISIDLLFSTASPFAV